MRVRPTQPDAGKSLGADDRTPIEEFSSALIDDHLSAVSHLMGAIGHPSRIAAVLSDPSNLMSYRRWTRSNSGQLLEFQDRAALIVNARSVLGSASDGSSAWTEPDLDTSRPPVFLVHGLGGSPDQLARLAHAAYWSGAEPYFVIYDDRRSSPLIAGQQMAEEIRERFAWAADHPVRIIGHSQGGLVARHALNALQQPGNPFFDDVRFDELHTPGGYDVPLTRSLDAPWLRWLSNLIHGIASALGWGVVRDWNPSSDALTGSISDWSNTGYFRHEPELSQLPFPTDRTFSTILDLNEDEVRDVLKFVVDDELPSHDTRLANYLRSLGRDERFGDFQRLVRARETPLGVAEFRILYRATFPPIDGNHVDLFYGDDVLERLFL